MSQNEDEFIEIPDEYFETIYKHPNEMAVLEKVFEKTYEETAENCLSSVVNVINDISEMPPVIAPFEMHPSVSDEESDGPYHARWFYIGVKRDKWTLADAEVVAVFRNDIERDLTEMELLHPDLLEFGSLITCEVVEGVMYSKLFGEVHQLTPLNLAGYFASVCDYEYTAVTSGSEKAETIGEHYRRVVEPHMNGRYEYPYDT